ncbi:MAG: NUDIX domain-containing protein, partial [Planctomycetota bacterium]
FTRVNKDTAAVQQHAAIANHVADPRAYNNALMDLGATVCTARNPRCGDCPWRQRCHSQSDSERVSASANPLRVASQRKVYSVAPSNRRLPRIPIVLALVHDEGRYLVARRPAGKRHGGHWELPGGKVEAGESDRQALARELAEETGLELLSARPFVTVYDNDGQRCWVLKVYRCRVFNPKAAKAKASDGLNWVSPRDFLLLDFPPANAAILQRFCDYHRLNFATLDSPDSAKEVE